MSDDVEALKRFVRGFVHARFESVPSKRSTSGKVHLEVWRTREKRRPVGLEMGHDHHVNFWLVSMYAPRTLPASIEVAKKDPKPPKGWTDASGSGANSNLSAYDEFHSKPIVRLAITTEADARLVLEHLLS